VTRVATAVLEVEPIIRLVFFVGLLLALGISEVLAPRRKRCLPRFKRWPGNLGIAAVNTLMLRIVFPTAAVGVALLAENKGWGVFNMSGVPGWIAIPASVIILDFVIYLQHVLFHAAPLLWRLHRMHHADVDIDVTTGVRFHPLEIALSMCIKLGVVIALGVPGLAVLIFEVLLNATSMFNHGNIRIPLHLDKVLRWLLVTPDMHRVHHSWYKEETNSNFGFNLPWWDRLFGTYRDQPGDGHEAMTIGLEQFRDPAWERLDRMLVQPFMGYTRSYEVEPDSIVKRPSSPEPEKAKNP
jgi:sterol desaturase/sphingolipid hydroxylase (fatty acid hydroxylase superfamily)